MPARATAMPQTATRDVWLTETIVVPSFLRPAIRGDQGSSRAAAMSWGPVFRTALQSSMLRIESCLLSELFDVSVLSKNRPEDRGCD